MLTVMTGWQKDQPGRMIGGENLNIRIKLQVLVPIIFLPPPIIPTYLEQIFVTVSFLFISLLKAPDGPLSMVWSADTSRMEKGLILEVRKLHMG